jgi:radical SAM superfamily enzyme YgiQ (UPF0313 family)
MDRKEMGRKLKKSAGDLLNAEIGTIRKRGAAIRVALVYPNQYAPAMSNLGYQTVYRLLNRIEEVSCERVFLPQHSGQTPQSIESAAPLRSFDVVAFSISFENDYPNVLTLLQQAGIPLQAVARKAEHPLVIAGGVACMLNPEPLAPFFDAFLLGEAEAMLSVFFATVAEFGPSAGTERKALLRACARRVPGTYVPIFYRPEYFTDGTLSDFQPIEDVPATVQRTYLENLEAVSTCSAVVTPYTTFDRTFLIEVGRGCPHGCRFCSAGFIYRPPRFRPLSLLQACMLQGLETTERIGLVGAAVSDLPAIGELCRQALERQARLSFSSLRADALDPPLLEVLRRSRVKTATIAPDAGSERLRRVINKGIDEETILRAVEILVAEGIPNLKLYCMVGLPTETEADVQAIVELCKRIKHTFLRVSRSRRRIGEITLSLNCFVPKPVTPFQWVAMDEGATLKQKLRLVREGLKKTANVRVHADVPRWAYLQALLSRGDRRVSKILQLAQSNDWNWPKTFKETHVNPDFYVLRARAAEERLPWDFIDHGVAKSFLQKEYRKALAGRTTPPCPMDRNCRACGVCNT